MNVQKLSPKIHTIILAVGALLAALMISLQHYNSKVIISNPEVTAPADFDVLREPLAVSISSASLAGGDGVAPFVLLGVLALSLLTLVGWGMMHDVNVNRSLVGAE